MVLPSTTSEFRDTRIEINVGRWIYPVTFSANGEYLVSGGDGGIRVWRVEDGKEMATMPVNDDRSVAVSKDGRWIAAGSYWGETLVWDARTYKQKWRHAENDGIIAGVDFSPDSTRLLTASWNRTASVWDIAARQRVLTLHHEDRVTAAKYAFQGDRVATTTPNSARVYDAGNGHLLVDIKVRAAPLYNGGLLWFSNHLFVMCGDRIKQFETSTGSAVSEWPVPDTDTEGCQFITLPKHGAFVAYSTNQTITMWDTLTHTQLGLIQYSEGTRSIALSPDDRFLAIGGKDGKVTIEGLSRVTGLIPFSRLYPTFQEPDLQIDDVVLNLWKNGQFADATAVLTATITASQNTSHHALASRALVRTRMREWDMALVDAEKAIRIQPSVISYLAKSIALVGKGERDMGYRTCDIAFEHFRSSHADFILLVKAVIMFIAGEHRSAISQIDHLVATAPFSSVCYVVQAYMHLLVGISHMEHDHYEDAIQSFERARGQARHHPSRTLVVISLMSGWKFDRLAPMIRERLCDTLYAIGRTKDAVKCFYGMTDELGGEANLHAEHCDWALDFRQRSLTKMEHLGDAAMNADRHEEAISHYITALSLDLPSPHRVRIKRDRAIIAAGSWQQALNDANEVIMLNPSSPWGYEIKHTALQKAGDYDNTVVALEAMLSRTSQSTDPDVQRHGDQYINPSSIRAMIRRTIQRTIRHLPRVLISTTTGRLHDRAEQASAFESLPIFNELISSMTTRIDYVWIKREVRQYFQYVMLSHKWEDNEPLFQQVVHVGVYDLDKSPTHDKLQTFCKIVRDAGFHWAWSDTCCIDKSDHFVLQEALVAMFRWYQGSAMTIVFLRGVRSSSQRGALVKSIWNTRAWTLQEYVAAKVIHFYTEDWTLYLDLELPNHKESLEVVLEMEEATSVSAEQLRALRPGLTNIREKLCLASTRKTTLVEDAAYSLLGIFSIAGISAIYGEGEASLGRLLAHLLAGSGDVSILSWTGESGNYNSCLPAHITVFNGSALSHLPSATSQAEMEGVTTASQVPSFDLDVALALYDRLNELPAPWFAASRLKLPCIVFELPSFLSHRARSGRVYRADTITFGRIEVKTRYDLSRMKSLYLVHPWLDALLERENAQSGAFLDEDTVPPLSPNTDDGEISGDELPDDGGSDEDLHDGEASDEDEDDFWSLPGSESPSELPASEPMDKETQARRLVARLRQPFGALLVTLASVGRRAVDYKRVAADSLIMVQIQESVSLADILGNVRTLDVL